MEIKIDTPAELPKDFYVYLHRKATTGEVFYVGKGFGPRAWKLAGTGRGKHWQNTVRKHGLIVEVAADRLQEWYAHELECELIALHGRWDLGYGPLVNLTDGGEGLRGHKLTRDQRVKQIESLRLRAKDPDYLAQRKALQQKITSKDEWKKNHKRAMQERALSQEHRAKMNSVYSDPEWRAKCKDNGVAKPIECLNISRVFRSISDAAQWLRNEGRPKASKSGISGAVRGKYKTAYGYTWRYADKDAA